MTTISVSELLIRARALIGDSRCIHFDYNGGEVDIYKWEEPLYHMYVGELISTSDDQPWMNTHETKWGCGFSSDNRDPEYIAELAANYYLNNGMVNDIHVQLRDRTLGVYADGQNTLTNGEVLLAILDLPHGSILYNGRTSVVIV